MSLLVDLQLVPNRILEVVKARILANRAKLTSQQQMAALVKGATRPRPQRQKFNAKAIDYRRPEPAAIRGGTSQIAGFTIAFSTNTITIGTKDGRVTKTVQRAERVPFVRKFVDDEVVEPIVYEYTTVNGEQKVSRSTKVSHYTYEATDYEGYGKAYAFPLDGSSCIVAVVDYSQRISIKRQATLTEVSVNQWDVDECGRIYLKSNRTDTTKEGGDLSVTESNDRKVYCFRVANSVVTEIPAPSAILDSLPAKLIEWQESPDISQAIWQEYSQGNTSVSSVYKCFQYTLIGGELGDLLPGQQYPPQAPDEYSASPVHVCEASRNYYQYVLGLPQRVEVCSTFIYEKTEVTSGPYNRIPKISLQYVVNQSTGAAPELDNWNPWGPPVAALLSLGAAGTYATPGVFGPLNGVTAEPPEGSTGNQIAQFYGLENVAPNVSVVEVAVPVQSGPIIKKRFDIYPGLLPAPSDPDPFSKLRKNPNGVMPTTALAVWDWGRPAYCRQRLKQAGFFPDPPPTP